MGQLTGEELRAEFMEAFGSCGDAHQIFRDMAQLLPDGAKRDELVALAEEGDAMGSEADWQELRR